MRSSIYISSIERPASPLNQRQPNDSIDLARRPRPRASGGLFAMVFFFRSRSLRAKHRSRKYPRAALCRSDFSAINYFSSLLAERRKERQAVCAFIFSSAHTAAALIWPAQRTWQFIFRTGSFIPGGKTFVLGASPWGGDAEN
jgi:hypothetical protein